MTCPFGHSYLNRARLVLSTRFPRIRSVLCIRSVLYIRSVLRPAPALAGSVLVALLVGFDAQPARGQSDDGSQRSVALDEAIDLALRYSPQAIGARANTESASSGLLEARGDYLPTLNLGSTFSTSSNERFDQATGRLVAESYSAQATANYEIFAFGRRIATNRAARARLDAAIAAERDQDFAVALQTTQLFYDVAAAAELTEVARQRLERARAQLSFAEVRLELGTVTRSDVLRAELEVGNAELALVDSDVALRAGALRMGRQIGISGEVLAARDALPSEAPALPTLPDLISLGESRSPGVVSAQANVRDRSAQKWSALTQYAPSLRVSGGLDWFSFDFPPSDRSWNLRVTASLPLFDGFSREASVSRARAQQRLTQAQYDDALIGARVEIEEAYREIRAAEQRVTIAERGVELAREDLRVQEERYQLGVATILDLQTSQVALADAENTWVLERQNLGLTLARLEAVLGQNLTEINE